MAKQIYTLSEIIRTKNLSILIEIPNQTGFIFHGFLMAFTIYILATNTKVHGVLSVAWGIGPLTRDDCTKIGLLL